MPSYRRLPSGKWQATVRLPDGRRATRSAPLKGTVQAWAVEEERKVRRGEWVDPAHARATVGGWVDTWSAARVVEDETARGDRAGLARIDAALGTRPLGTLSRIAVQGWVRQMQANGVGPAAVRRTYNR